MRDVLVLSLGGSRIGILSACVRRVLPMALGTPSPASIALVEQVLDWHGSPLPVLDLRRWLGVPASPPALTDRLVVVDLRGQAVALRVEQVLDVATVTDETFHQARDLSPSLPGVAGAVPLEDGMLLVYDVDAFLTDAEAAALRDALVAVHG